MVAKRVLAATGVTTYCDGYGVATHYNDGRVVAHQPQMAPCEADTMFAAFIAHAIQQGRFSPDASLDMVMNSLLIEAEHVEVTAEQEIGGM